MKNLLTIFKKKKQELSKSIKLQQTYKQFIKTHDEEIRNFIKMRHILEPKCRVNKEYVYTFKDGLHMKISPAYVYFHGYPRKNLESFSAEFYFKDLMVCKFRMCTYIECKNAIALSEAKNAVRFLVVHEKLEHYNGLHIENSAKNVPSFHEKSFNTAFTNCMARLLLHFSVPYQAYKTIVDMKDDEITRQQKAKLANVDDVLAQLSQTTPKPL